MLTVFSLAPGGETRSPPHFLRSFFRLPNLDSTLLDSEIVYRFFLDTQTGIRLDGESTILHGWY
jgi:hypothetical protein